MTFLAYYKAPYQHLQNYKPLFSIRATKNHFYHFPNKWLKYNYL